MKNSKSAKTIFFIFLCICLPLQIILAEDEENIEINSSITSNNGETTETNEENAEDTDDDIEPQEEKTNPYYDTWLRDSALILKLIAPARKFKSSNTDSSLQAKQKKKEFAKQLRELNKKYRNHVLKVEVARFKDVEEEKVLSKYGVRKAKRFVRRLKRDPQGRMLLSIYGSKIKDNFFLAMAVGMQMASCKKCWRKTGRFIAEYEIPKPSIYSEENTYNEYDSGIFESNTEYEDYNTISVEIKKIIKSKSKALSLKKGQIQPLTGKLKDIEYEASYSESIKLLLE